MTRGTLFYYESDDAVWQSTEFNGDMYHGNQENPQGIGDEVIKLMTKLKSLDDFKKVLAEINKRYKYEEGNDCWDVGTSGIQEHIDGLIKWIEEERQDLKGDKSFDPRTWKEIPSFRNANTWQFWGVPNLSDYSYIYNNSGEDLVITTRGDNSTPFVKNWEMTIPNGCLGVLNYGHKDCLCKDGKIIDGMGNYEEDDEEDDHKPVLKKIRALAEFAYGNKNLTVRIMPNEVWEVTKECPKSLMIKNGNIELRINKPEPNKIWEFIYG